MGYSFHHLTLEPEKIIKKIKKIEEREIDECSSLIYQRKAFIKAGYLALAVNGDNTVPELENHLEQVVLKKWGGIISIYPVTITPYQENKVPWILGRMGDVKKNSITQKYGSIMVIWDAASLESLEILFMLKGNVIRKCELPINNSYIGSEEYTFERYVPDDMLQAIKETDFAKQSNGVDLDIPIMLPTSWREEWEVYDQTQFVTLCD